MKLVCFTSKFFIDWNEHHEVILKKKLEVRLSR